MRSFRFPLLPGIVLALTLLPAIAGRAAAGADGEKVVIPFDFVSKFDDGRYGRTVGELIWQGLDRQGRFIIPETMLDVRDTCASNSLQPSPERSLDEMKKIVQEDFGAQIGIWGSVERVPGQEWDVYDLVIKCVDFSAQPEPKVIYQRTARTKTVSEIPHLYVAELLDALYGRSPAEPPPADQLAEENWKNGPNLMTGDFQQAERGVPVGWAPGWQAGEVDQWEPLGTTVQWIAEAGNPTNRVIRFTLSKPLGDSTGVAYYSELFPVQEGAKYRLECRWRSDGPEVKVFVKCYDHGGGSSLPLGPAEGGRGNAEGGTGGGNSLPPSLADGGRGIAAGGAQGYVPDVAELREVYRSQQNLKGPKDTWNIHTEDFTPQHTRYAPRWGRVMLYAYLGAGQVEFDDVVVKRIIPVSPGHEQPEARHSLQTEVTVEEMEENRRRSLEATQGQP